MRILMLGNSLTTANGLPDALAERLEAQVVAHARGGARLAEHLNPKTALGARTTHALAEGDVDFVVLQEMSNGPLRNRDRFIEVTCTLADAARTAGAKPILYATWAYEPSSKKLAKLGCTHREMHAAMHAAAEAAARESGAALADACLDFFEHPRKDALYASDGVHPSLAGTQVVLDCLARAIQDAGASEGPASPAPTYTVYLMRCEDGTFYTGITTDVKRRLKEHLSRGPKAARYTRTHPVAALEATWRAGDRAEASRLEYRVKRLTHSQKELLADDPSLLDRFLSR